MPNRRDFLKNAPATTAGVAISRRFPSFQIGAPPGKRREVSIGGRRVKTVDAHAHCFVPEVWDLVKDTPLAATAKANLTGNIALGNPQRLIDMDAQGIESIPCASISMSRWGLPSAMLPVRFDFAVAAKGVSLTRSQTSGTKQWACASTVFTRRPPIDSSRRFPA